MEEIQIYLDECREMMNKAITHLRNELAKIRAGKANPSMIDSVMVEYYGAPTPLSQVSSVTTPDARSLMIKPWERNIIPNIEKAIIDSNLGFNPQNDGEQIIINIPQLTQDRRVSLMKQAKHEGEQAKISIRSTRKDVNDGLKQLQKDGAPEDEIKRAEEKVQGFTDEFTKKIDEILSHKEVEIMTV